ncbi:hypothetical protein BH23CHL4_BH23CHL4_20620 [soil metagenome]
MNPEPTGRLIRTPDGRTLLITRTFRAPIEDVWASLTESERTARWIGPWTGEGRVGGTVMVQMTEEEGAEPSAGVIRACDPPRSFSLDLDSGEAGSWSVAVELTEDAGITTLELKHHLYDTDDVSSIGPGWEYYLDRLVAAETGGEMREWEEYYPGMKGWYEGKEETSA